MTSPTLDGFVDTLLEEKGLTGVDDGVLAEMKQDLLSRLENRINAAIVAALPVDKLDGMQAVVEQGGEKEIQAYCLQYIPGLNELVASELLAFRQTYLS